MAYYQRNILICKLKNLEHQNTQHISFVPELHALQSTHFKKIFRASKGQLRQKGKILLGYEKAYGLGIIPMNLNNARKFVEDLYCDLLKSGIPLPDNVSENDMKYTIKHYGKSQNNIIVDIKKIKIEQQKLTFFAKYLPLFGTMITFTLTIGLTLTTMTTLVGWGWSLLLFLLFGVSKFLTSYADISGGPERRFQGIGFWLDRLIFGKYHGAKRSYPRILLNALVSAILACSCLLTWYAGWQMICHLNGLSVFPEYFAYTFAGLYAWSSASSNFGRLYNQLYDLLLNFVGPYFSFDNVKKEDKLNLKELSAHCLALQKSGKIPATPAKKPLLFHYRHQCVAKAKEVLCQDKPRTNHRSGIKI